MKTIAVAGTFDTKGEEFAYVRSIVQELGFIPYMIHTGVFAPAFPVDVTNQEIAAAAGYHIEEIASRKDRAMATEALSKGMEILLPKLYKAGKFDGIISFGGSGGTSLVTPAMRALPIGVPKVMVSTMASGNVAQYVGTSDILMMPSIVDVAGLNKISKTIFRNGVLAVAGMVGARESANAEKKDTKPMVAATMFGVTTPCVEKAKKYLEEHGYEVLVFHATGMGGRTMEALINGGFFKGVLDLTTTEWCDEIVGGVLSAGNTRCEAAVKNKIPQVVSVGACDMVNFGPMDTVPKAFLSRKLYKHNPTVTLMRTTVEENKAVGTMLSSKWNQAQTDMTILLPAKGVSMIDGEGQPFEGAEERKALFDAIRAGITNEKVKIVEKDAHINDEEFAVDAAKELIRLMDAQKKEEE